MLYVVQPYKNNPSRLRKPVALVAEYQPGGSQFDYDLAHLVDTHPEAIYFSDDVEADFSDDVEADFEAVSVEDDDDLALLNRALNHAVSNGVITDSEADHLERLFERDR